MRKFVSIQIDPVSKPRMTQRDKWTDVGKNKGRPAVLRYFNFRDAVREALPDYDLPGVLHVTFFVSMPKSWSHKKRQQMLGAPVLSKPDVDNYAKAFMDAFKTDDSHVYDLHAEKYYAAVGSIDIDLASVEDQS